MDSECQIAAFGAQVIWWSPDVARIDRGLCRYMLLLHTSELRYRNHGIQCLRVNHHVSLKEDFVDRSISIYKALHLFRKMQG